MKSVNDFLGWLFSGEDKSSRCQPSVQPSPYVRPIPEAFARTGRGTAEPSDWPVGKVVGNIYEIRGVLGRGGMGVVYRAYDRAMHRDIAVKVPLGRWELDPSGTRRLVRFVDSPQAKKDLVDEVRHWIGLVHPHVVRAFDVIDNETTDYQPTILMDYCDGGSLAGRIYRGQPLSVATGLDVAIQVCYAMEYVHGQKLVHRDLKSQNVLLMGEANEGAGKALVTDLGLAKALGVRGGEAFGPARDADEAALWVTVSAAGGTPTHMAPEQWQAGAHVGAASDVYAFGVLLYELFCRRLPFVGGRELSRWQQAHRTVAAPDPQDWNHEIPSALADLMRQCLAKETAARPGGFGELAEGLAKLYRAISGRDFGAVRVKPPAAALTAEAKKQQARAKIRLGSGAYRRGDLEAALREMKEAQGLFASLGDRLGLSESLGNQAVILQAWGCLEEAMNLHREEAICREFGDRAGLGASLCNQAVILKTWGRLKEAMGLLKQQEAICREFGDRSGLSASLGNQALILQAWGRLEEAMKLHQQAETICRELGDAEGLATSLGNQASILGLNLGRRSEALAKGEEALRLCSQAGLAPLAKQLQGIFYQIRAGRS